MPRNDKPFIWPLMKSAIGTDEKRALVDFINHTDRFTNGQKVIEFERKWSEWQGCKYSVFVSSGSTANLILLDALRELSFQGREMRILSQACTWGTNISSLIHLKIPFLLSDNDLFHFGFCQDDLTALAIARADVNVIWLTHLLGSPAPIEAIQSLFPNAMLIEDVCESPGATTQHAKVGLLGKASTFSFYYGHHMTTIEGGMVCTNDFDLYELLVMKRSHGMIRELTDSRRQQIVDCHPDIDPHFLFATSGFNARSNELSAVLGLEQLKKLDSFIDERRVNLGEFDLLLQAHPNQFMRFNVSGNSAMALPFLCKDPEVRNSLMTAFNSVGVETRPFLIGNVQRQPFLLGHPASERKLPNADWLHSHAFYIGNWPGLPREYIPNLSRLIADVLQ